MSAEDREEALRIAREVVAEAEGANVGAYSKQERAMWLLAREVIEAERMRADVAEALLVMGPYVAGMTVVAPDGDRPDIVRAVRRKSYLAFCAQHDAIEDERTRIAEMLRARAGFSMGALAEALEDVARGVLEGETNAASRLRAARRPI